MIVEEQSRSQSNMTSQTMGIANNAVVFDLLVNRLYSNKPLAIIREYICNAYDAQVDAGNIDTPIKLHLPTRLEPFFSIRDYGTGMSAETIKDVFSTLGESTKRNSNEVTGMLGIGSKSALTANDSFMVTSYYNGFKNIYSVFLDNGMPNISHFGTMPSDEPNGLDINVPVPASWIAVMQQEAEKFLKYFQGKLKVNTQLNLDLGIILYQGDNWKIYNNTNKPVVLMGNIPYPMDEKLLSSLTTIYRTEGLVIEAPIGSVQFAASREALSYTDSTLKTLGEINKQVSEQLLAEVKIIERKYNDNLIELSKALKGLPYNIKNLIRNSQKNPNIDYSFDVCGNDFKFRIPRHDRPSMQSFHSLSPSLYNHVIIMADSLPKAQEVCLHHKDQGVKSFVVTFDIPQSNFGTKEDAQKALKHFCDILGKPYVIATEEHTKLFGSTKTVGKSKGVVANNLMYRATGFTYSTSKITSVSTNTHLVSTANKNKTIGIPLYNGNIMDVTYTTSGFQSIITDIRYILNYYKPKEELQIVYIPKTHKAHLANTIDVYTWLKSLVLPNITTCTSETRSMYSRDAFSSYELRDLKLPQGLQRYIKEVNDIVNHPDNTQYIECAKRLGIPLKVQEVTGNQWLDEAHKRYDVLKVAAGNLRYSNEHKARFEKLAQIIEKDCE